MDGNTKEAPPTSPAPEALAIKLNAMIDELPPEGVTLRDLLVAAGDEGLMILTALLSLVFLIPVSIPGVSTVFGAAILMIAVARLGSGGLWLPERLLSRSLPTEKLRPVLLRALVWMHRLERVSEPNRMARLAGNGLAHLVNAAGLILGALLLMAPFGLIPFSNTLPAIALLCLAVGLVQRDGICILLGHLGNILSIAYFGLLLTGGGMALREGWRQLFG